MAIGKEALGVPSRPHGPSRIRRIIGRAGLTGLLLGGGGVAGYETYQHNPAFEETVNSLVAPLADRWNNLQQARADNQFLQERSLGPQESETANAWWKELSTEEIKKLATLPDINQIGEKYMSTVSPTLQEKARQADYKLIYQADPNDTVGRSVVTKGRIIDAKDWSTDDLGFGRAGTTVRGIFEAWVPDPKDPNQKEKVYALLKDPNTKREFMIAVQLFPFDPNQFDIRPTWFVVDNLYYGPNNEDPSTKGKKATDYPTFNELLRNKGLNLQDLVSPGDFIRAGMQVAGVDETKGINRYKTDDAGVARSMMFIVRRFGGLQQWQTEVKK